MPMPIHVRNPDGTPYQIQSVITPSRKLSPEDLYKAGAITAKEYLSRTGRLQPADGLASALMPRTAAADDAGTLQQLLVGVSDVASLPGRAYASLGRPVGEPYQSALARLAAAQDEGGADRFSEGVLRDPANILAPIGLSALSKIPAVARGLAAAGRYGSLAADVGANTAAQAVANRSIGEDAGVPQSAAMNLAFGLGAHGLSGLARSGMRMISPEERAANFKNWFGDSKVVDEAGNPLVVYHGTESRGGFDAFDPEKIGTSTDDGFLGKGFYFTTSEPTADAIGGITKGQKRELSPSWAGSEYGEGGSSGAFYVSAKNPVVLKPDGWSWDKRHLIRDHLGISRDATSDDILDALQKSGNDAVVLDYSGGGWPHQEIMIPSPTQIKSATGNRGTFDPNDPNITHLAGSPAYPQSLASIAASRIVNSGKQAAAMKAQEQ